MELTDFENYVLELARQVWKKRPDVSQLISTHGRKYGPVSTEGWFTVELMILLKKGGYEVQKVQKPGDIKVTGHDITGEGQKIEIRASSVHKYKHIIDGWKERIDFLLFAGIINEKDEKKLKKEKSWRSWVVRIDNDVAVGLLKKENTATS
jgi:hypothetical protein